MHFHPAQLLSTLLVLPSLLLAKSLPKFQVILLPAPTIYVGESIEVGFQDVSAEGGYTRNISLALVYPNQTSSGLGSVGSGEGCHTTGSKLTPLSSWWSKHINELRTAGTYLFGLTLHTAGNYTLVTNVTYGLSVYNNCTAPYTYQSEILENFFLVVDAPASQPSAYENQTASYVPVTATFATARTGSPSSSAVKNHIVGAEAFFYAAFAVLTLETLF